LARSSQACSSEVRITDRATTGRASKTIALRRSPRRWQRPSTPSAQKQAYADYNDYVLDQSQVINMTTFLPRAVTRINVRGLKYDMAYLLDGSETWLN
jgi:hypothetical protein